MAQYDFGTIDPNTKSGTALASDLNSWRNAVHSTHSGATAPSYTTAAMLWADTTSANYELKMYDGAQWITVAVIDATNNVARVAIDAAETSYITSTTNAQIRHVIANADVFTTRSTGIQFNIASPVIADSNNNELLTFTTTASAVNQVAIANAATGNPPTISSAGGDTNINLLLTAKGTGIVYTYSETSATNTVIDVARLEARSTGTPAAGIGTSLLFATETAANNFEIGARINAFATDVTAGAENFALAFRTMRAGAAATEIMRMANVPGVGPQIGIGTSTPGANFNIVQTEPSANLEIQFDNTQSSTYVHVNSEFVSQVDFSVSSTSVGSLYALDTTSGMYLASAVGDITLQPSSIANAFVVKGSGNVGIGTSAPQALLELSSNNTALTALNILRFNDEDTSTAANQPTGKIEFYINDASAGGTGVGSFIQGFAAGTSGGGYLTLATSNNAATGAVERLRVAPNGAIGIGGANYGTAGQVFTSGGSGAAPSWAAVDVGPGTAGLAVGDVGSYALMSRTGTTLQAAGSTLAGSSLIYASASGQNASTAGAGTWRCMGHILVNATFSSANTTTLWLRIS